MSINKLRLSEYKNMFIANVTNSNYVGIINTNGKSNSLTKPVYKEYKDY